VIPSALAAWDAVSQSSVSSFRGVGDASQNRPVRSPGTRQGDGRRLIVGLHVDLTTVEDPEQQTCQTNDLSRLRRVGEGDHPMTRGVLEHPDRTRIQIRESLLFAASAFGS
jgi:hypothetical protein